ncbi:MAG TPA: glycosyltransferase family 39 protein [Pyrinomonadaceae bacterium]|nr:glycosyltransferase family 39 protein [Pyrinomonadaceae bacterium]
MESPAPARPNSTQKTTAGSTQKRSTSETNDARRRKCVAFALVFAAAFGVRLLCWNDVRGEASKVQTAVTENYRQTARLIRENGAASLFLRDSPTNDPDLLGHPPGYPVVLASVNGLFGESDAAVQIFQAACDALAAAFVFLIAAELLTFGVGLIAGALAALAPQFCWNSVMLLPDTLAVLPLLAAFYLLLRARAGRGMWKALAAGALVGASCWLRANALLLAPFLALFAPVLFARGARLRLSSALVGGAVLALAPLTLRNAVVYGHFIPASLGAGQTFVEGIGDYDPERRFGLPATDVELMKMEAEEHGRPDYASTLFGADAVARDRERTRRALSVVAAHPLWFSGVMLRRAGSMLRLERTPLASTLPVSEGWTRAPRLAVRAAQKLFVTAVFLPLYLAGVVLLIRARRRRELAALVAVPLYYLCAQSALHTEYRYVLAVHYLLFIAAAAALYHAGLFARDVWAERVRPRKA